MCIKDDCEKPIFDLNSDIYVNDEGLCDCCRKIWNFCVLALIPNDCDCVDFDSAVSKLLEIIESCGCMDSDKAKYILYSKLLEERFYSFISLRSKYLKLIKWWKNGFDPDYIGFLTFNNSDIDFTSFDKQKEVFDNELKEFKDELSNYMLKFC